jgi:wyosine [tRNA(Phe)-imidazoG37] synthetase (radical SAM superfamily)
LVKSEIEDWLKHGGKADFITLAGSGEPTLHSRFGELIDFIHARSDIPVALLTNGTTLFQPEVRAAAGRADLVKVTLATWNQRLFERIHRPCRGVTFRRLVEGERRLREEFHGKLWVEVFVLRGINSTADDMRRIAKIARTIQPDRVQLNTSVRPPAEPLVRAVSGCRLKELARRFGSTAEVVADFRSSTDSPVVRAHKQLILSLLRRRPCTAVQISGACNLQGNECAKYLGRLLQQGAIHADRTGGGAYYTPTGRKQGART